MMQFSAKLNPRKAVAKLSRMMQTVDRDEMEALATYARSAVKVALSITPPANGGKKVDSGRVNASGEPIMQNSTLDSAAKMLRARIAEDWAYNTAPPGARWQRVGGENRLVLTPPDQTDALGRKKRGANIGPFLAVSGKITDAKRREYNVGKYGVKLITGLRSYVIAHSDVYKMRRRGNAMRLTWHGPRHAARLGDIRKEISRRQKQVGKLMAGWRAMASWCGAKLPAFVQAFPGKGEAKLTRPKPHAVQLTGKNSTPYGRADLNKALAKNRGRINRSVAAAAKVRQRVLRKKLKQSTR